MKISKTGWLIISIILSIVFGCLSNIDSITTICEILMGICFLYPLGYLCVELYYIITKKGRE